MKPAVHQHPARPRRRDRRPCVLGLATVACAHTASLLRAPTSRSVTSTRTNEIANSRVATAAAWFGWNCAGELEDQHRRRERLAVMLPETITMTPPNSPIARANVEQRSRGDAGAERRQHDPSERVPAGRAEDPGRLLLRLVDLQQDRLHGAHHERQRDEQQGEQDPERREDHVDAVALEEPADRRSWAVERAEHDPGDERRDRERQVHDRREPRRPGTRSARARTRAACPKTALMIAVTAASTGSARSPTGLPERPSRRGAREAVLEARGMITATVGSATKSPEVDDAVAPQATQRARARPDGHGRTPPRARRSRARGGVGVPASVCSTLSRRSAKACGDDPVRSEHRRCSELVPAAEVVGREQVVDRAGSRWPASPACAAFRSTDRS